MLPNADAVMRLADVATGWLLTYFVHSTVILLAAWLIASRRRMSEATREIVWKSAIIGGILTATVQSAVTREPLGGHLRLAPRTRDQIAPALRMTVPKGLDGPTQRYFVIKPRTTHWTTGVFALWLTTAGLGLLWLTFRHARLVRVLGTRASLDGTPIGRRLSGLIAETRVEHDIELTCSGRIASPVALSGNEVCLPRRALLELDASEQESMLAHEVAHLVRRDPQWLVAARVIEMVLFFQPLNRIARHRMQEAAEFLCDDWAVARTSRPVTLAKCLAAVAEWVGRAPKFDGPRLQPVSAMVESGGSPLVRRVGRILNGRGVEKRHTSRVAFGVSAMALVMLAGVAPRVSIASSAGQRRSLTFVRAFVEKNGMTAQRDTMVLFQTAVPREGINALVRQRFGSMGGAVTPRGDVVFQRLTVTATSRDSLANAVTWTRRVTAPLDSDFAEPVIMPLSDTVRTGVLVVERRRDR